MSNALRYIVYRCDTCDRETELVLDGRRPDPLRCNITQLCRGKLQRRGTRNAREFLFTPLVPGLQDFTPRGTTITSAPKPVEPNPITILTAAGEGIIAMSVLRRTDTMSAVEFSVIDETSTSFTVEVDPSSFRLPQHVKVNLVLFEISPAMLVANKYVYSISGPVQLISGQDDSPEGRNLRFTASNQLSVYVNGIKLDPSSYDRSVNDQVTFTPAIFDTNNVVEIFVYQDLTTVIDQSRQVTLEFRSLRPAIPADVALRELDCWGNFGGAVIDDVERMILYCTDLTALNRDKNYGVARADVISAIDGEVRTILQSEVFILLGREPFSFRDKEMHAYLSGTTLITEQAILSYRQSSASGTLQLTVDDSSITQVFNPIGLSRRILNLTSNSPTTLTGTPLEGTENLKPKYILGPS